MNAKELADKLDIKDASSQDIEVAKMLCQQADKINVLEMIEMFKDNCIQRLEEDLTHSLELNKVQRNQIARLKAKIEKLNLRLLKKNKKIQNMAMDAVVKVGQEIDAMPQTDVASIRDFVSCPKQMQEEINYLRMCIAKLEKNAEQQKKQKEQFERLYKQWQETISHVVYLQEKLSKYEGGSPMLLNKNLSKLFKG